MFGFGKRLLLFQLIPPSPLRVVCVSAAISDSGLAADAVSVLKCLKMSRNVFFCPENVEAAK
jgi:hypothetical protein